jgi:hypothetical protein
VDLLSAKYTQLSPYNYADNNPVNDFDIDGMQNNNSESSEQGGNEVGPQPESEINESVLPEINGVVGPWSLEAVEEFENKDNAETEKEVTDSNDSDNLTDPFIGDNLIKMIKGLEKAPDGYKTPETFKSTGLKPTYENATKYIDCSGNCYMTSVSRVNKAFQDNYGITPIDIVFNTNGTVTTKDYQLASTQSRAEDSPYYGYGVGGVLASKGYGEVVDDDKIWTDMLPGAQIQLWSLSIGGGGHSIIFKEYGRDETGEFFVALDNNSKGVERKYYKSKNGAWTQGLYYNYQSTYSLVKPVNLLNQ